jgi:ubiquinone/menaquinone biosynthesis C-methylase UbiE
VLDVCSGTGALTSLTADRVGTGGAMIGIDLSLKRIKMARERARLSAASFQNAPSESLPFSENTFDRSFISLSLHEIPGSARQNTLKETCRTLKPGGSLVALDYNLPRGTFARLVIRGFVRLLEEEFAYKMLLEGSLPAET